MPDFYSPEGNPEVWAEKPEGYYTPEEWAVLHSVVVIEPTLDELKAAKKNEIAAARYETTSGAITINGYTYAINTDSRTAFIGAMALVKVQDADSMQWKTVNGFVTLSAEEFTKIVSIGLAYINTCFGAENAIWEQIDTVSTAEELDSIVWTAPDVDDVIAAIEQKQTTE